MLQAAGTNEDEKTFLCETLAEASDLLPDAFLMMLGHWQPLLVSMLATENARILRSITDILALSNQRREGTLSEPQRSDSRLSLETTSESGYEALRDLGMLKVERLSLSSGAPEK